MKVLSNESIGKIFNRPVFLLMLVFPTVLQSGRGLFLAFILFGAMVALTFKSVTWRISKGILFWLIVSVYNSMFFVFWGLLHNSPGAVSVSTVYIIWPILFVFLIGLSAKIDAYVFLIKILMCGSFIASISAILLVSSRLFSQFAFLEPYFALLDGDVGLNEGTIGFALASMPNSIYGLLLGLTQTAEKINA